MKMEDLCSKNTIHYENLDAAISAVNDGADMGWQPLLALQPTDNQHATWMQFAYLLTCIYNKGKTSNRRFTILRNS